MEEYFFTKREDSYLLHFNERIVECNTGSDWDNNNFPIIKENPLLLDLEDEKGLVCVPTLLDCFLFKTDIITFSKSGLRPKDCVDILFLVSNFSQTDSKNAIMEIKNSPDAKKKFLELNNLLSNKDKVIQEFSLGVGYSFKENIGNAIFCEKKLNE